jgi:hypothetical protein
MPKTSSPTHSELRERFIRISAATTQVSGRVLELDRLGIRPAARHAAELRETLTEAKRELANAERVLATWLKAPR